LTKEITRAFLKRSQYIITPVSPDGADITAGDISSILSHQLRQVGESSDFSGSLDSQQLHQLLQYASTHGGLKGSKVPFTNFEISFIADNKFSFKASAVISAL
jgi:hypothetical protein